ncbi:FUSC family protein [Herbaspirillum sp. RTI4]|uniref:FUSC family protein n=1 Tax=Herbaspirillum sp. RTI4 TaxID=3048640 RepID=UPI002AB384A1|nr:FUSC family protein [Herbaspirillum sp. RTI4]MDY7578390.1 FUSC family protein [Herbaspirillum sp. RTI4]MEA9983069.1 FUSC family protein [Herbaspirillum sp. RTI4]
MSGSDSSAAISAPSTPPASLWQQIREAATSWNQTERPTWIYIFKMVFAALLALGIGMRLDLDSPRTAMTTVFIVMQPQSGMIFAKSFYRIAGTLVGSLAVVLFVALFAQTPELFLLCTAIWIGLCTAGSAYNRNFRSYGFVLSGYTVALIGIPAVVHPALTFDSVVTRVTELSLGIVCAAVVSALIFPQRSTPALIRTIRSRFSAFVDLIGGTLGGSVDRQQLENTNARFIGDIIGLEAMRSSAVFEDPDVRLRSGRLTRMNSEFMALSTRVHALHQLMNRMHGDSHAVIVEAIESYFREVGPLLTRSGGEPVMSATDAADASEKLLHFKAELPKRIRATRGELADAQVSASALLDFDTASELLYRVIEELHAYTATYASLVPRTHEREQRQPAYVPKTSLLTASIAGVRAGIVLLILSAFWIASGWPSGDFAALNAAAICAIVSALPNPAAATKKMAYGIAIAIGLGYVYAFHIFPHLDGFLLLASALLPVLLLAVYMTTRPATAGIGMGMCIFFTFLAVPDNQAHFNAVTYFNQSAALMTSIIVSTIAFQVLLPPATAWLVRHMEKQLRKQVVQACFGKLPQLAASFESGTRDLMHQINALTSEQAALQKSALGWMFATLEIGHAVIELRLELELIERDWPKLLPSSAQLALKELRDYLPALFADPNARTLAAAFHANNRAINAVHATIGPAYRERSERHRLQRTLSYLHFIRTALLDEQSPLQPLHDRSANNNNNIEGKPHAA